MPQFRRSARYDSRNPRPANAAPAENRHRRHAQGRRAMPLALLGKTGPAA